MPEDRHLRAERDHRERQERRHGREDRREEVDRLVGQRRDDLFLERQLHAVGQRLQQAPRADPVGADPVLHAADDLALEHDREQRHDDQEREDADDLDQRSSQIGWSPKPGQVLHRRRALCEALTSSTSARRFVDRRRSRTAPSVAGPRPRGRWSAARPPRRRSSAIATGSVERAGVGRDGDRVAARRRRARPRWRRRARRGPAWRCRPGARRRPAAAGVEQLGARWRARASPAPRRRRAAAAARLRRELRGAPDGAEPGQLGARRPRGWAARGRRPAPRRARPAPGRRSARRCSVRSGRTGGAGPPRST